jgi:uncharacterized membrane protein
MTDIDIDLQTIPLFAELEPAALSALKPLLQPVNFAPGQTILIEGEPGDCCYIILSGRVNFITKTAAKEEVVLGDAGKSEYFGEWSMLTGAPRAARVVALEATQTLSLKFDVFENFLLAHPRAAIDVLKTLAMRLQKSDLLLQENGAKNVNQIDDARMTLGDRVSDALANTIGSWAFIASLSVILLVWVGWNSIAAIHNMMDAAHPWPAWDAYPFVFLNLALSFLAAYSAPIIMMSQNRAASKDRLAAEIDHDTNVKSEVQISQLMKRLDDLEKSVNYKRN